MILTGRAAAASVGGAVVVAIAPVDAAVGLAVVVGVLVVLLVVDRVRTPAPRAFEVERTLPPALVLGGSAGELVWRVRAPAGSGRAVRIGLADELPPSLGASRRRASLLVPRGGSASARADLLPTRRGVVEPRTLSLRVVGPLGLVARQTDLAVPGRVRITPPLRAAREAELRVERERLLEVGLRSARGRGGGTDFEALREATPDDELRRIDWGATVRTGRTIVRTYRAERNQNVLVLLDAGRLMAARVAGVPRFEHALDALLALVAVATRVGDRIGLLAYADRVHTLLPASSRREQLGRVADACAALGPVLVESDVRGALATATGRSRRRALLVMLTDLAPAAAEEGLLPALPLVARDHLVVIGAVADPRVEGWARDAPVDAGGAYRAAAAAGSLDERRRLAGRLRAMGAVVVDAAPGRLPPAVVDAYLDAKATGRL